MFNKNIDNEALTVGSVLLPILEKLGIDTIFGIPVYILLKFIVG